MMSSPWQTAYYRQINYNDTANLLYIDSMSEKKDHLGNSTTNHWIFVMQDPAKGNFEKWWLITGSLVFWEKVKKVPR